MNIQYAYVAAYHWAVITTSTGSMEIKPENTAERIFTIGCLLVGVLVGCSLVSSISANVMEAHALSLDSQKNMWMMNRYLAQHTVNKEMSVRVLKQAKAAMIKSAVVSASQVEVLSTLSLQLRMELQSAVFSPHVLRHPLFRLWSNLYPPIMQHMCWEAMRF